MQNVYGPEPPTVASPENLIYYKYFQCIQPRDISTSPFLLHQIMVDKSQY